MQNSLLRFIRIRVVSFSILLASCHSLWAAPSTNWGNGPELPTELARATGVYFPANGRFYAMGGRISNAAGADMTTPYEYNPRTNSWSYKTAPFPDNQVSNMACGVLTVDGTPYIYCVGGIAASGARTATKRAFRYDPISDKIEATGIDPWNEKAPDTLPSGFAVVDNKLYILGGLTLANGATDRIFEFDPENSVGSQWVQKRATLPVALAFVPATAIGNLIYTAGGATAVSCTYTDTQNSWVYDPVKDSISAIAKISRATSDTQAVTVGEEMWIMGGRTAPDLSVEVNIYNPTTGQWRLGDTLNQARRNFAAASDGSRVFVVGGYACSNGTIKTTEIHQDSKQPAESIPK